jgi:hypothetical protein
VHIVLLQIAVGPNADSSNFGWISCEALLFGQSSERGWGRNIQAIKSDHEASAKASAHLAHSETNPCHLQGLLPAWSNLNDLIRLRAAIITSCIPGARKI